MGRIITSDLLATFQLIIQCHESKVFIRRDQKLKGGQLYRINHSMFPKHISKEFSADSILRVSQSHRINH